MNLSSWKQGEDVEVVCPAGSPDFALQSEAPNLPAQTYLIKQEGLRQARVYTAECGVIGHYYETAILAAYMAGYCNAKLPTEIPAQREHGSDRRVE